MRRCDTGKVTVVCCSGSNSAARSESVLVADRSIIFVVFFFFQAEDGIRDLIVTGVQTCALPISSSPPNQIRDFTSVPANNSTFGTLDIRRTFTNNTGANITRLRFRIVDLTTFPAPLGIADLRPLTSTAVVVTVDRPPCGAGTSNVTVQGTTLEQPPTQSN